MTEGPKGSKWKQKSNDKAEGAGADSSNDVSDQVVIKIKPNSWKCPSNESKATGSVDDMDKISDQGEAKGKPKSHKHPTNSLNLPGAVKSESALWRITILGAYRAYMACTCEVWTVNHNSRSWTNQGGTKYLQLQRFISNLALGVPLKPSQRHQQGLS